MSMDATEILHTAEICIGDRAASRDQPDGERSMARTVAAFNALTGHRLSERDGWLFMVTLKAARPLLRVGGTMRMTTWMARPTWHWLGNVRSLPHD